jgi:hypothetical protein
MRVLVGGAALVVALGTGALVASVRGWGSPNVVVDVVNAAEVSIVATELTLGTCGTVTRIASDAITSDAIASNESRRFAFPVCGEGGYRLRVTFADGREITSGGAYVEGGYRISERVSRERIDTRSEWYRL